MINLCIGLVVGLLLGMSIGMLFEDIFNIVNFKNKGTCNDKTDKI